MANDLDRLLSQYSEPVRLWPGESAAFDDEAIQNAKAAGVYHEPPKNGWDRDTLLPWAYEVKDGKRSPSGQFAMPQLGADVLNAIYGVGNAPLLGPYNPSQRDEMIEHAGAIVGPQAGIGIARGALTHAPSGTHELGMFGGRRGAEALAAKGETRPLQALDMLERMEKEGRSREEIWAETNKILEGSPYAGAFRGVDKMPRFEVNDLGTGLKKPLDEIREAGRPSPLDMVYSHDDLFNAYPSARDVEFWPTMDYGPGHAAFHETGNGLIRVGFDDANPFGAHMAAQRTTPHEVQHKLQAEEGFARGDNPSRYDVPSERLAQILNDEAAFPPGESHFGNAILAAAKQQYPHFAGDTLGDLRGFLRTLSGGDVSPGLTASIARRMANDKYLRSAGEVEARTVQKRQDLSPEERRSRAPWLDYDIPEEKQIVRMGGEGIQKSLPRDAWDRISALDRALSGDHARAIDEWVGGAHDARSRGSEGGLMMPERLEKLPPDQLQSIASPVREILREYYGDHIPVYRGVSEGGPSTGRQGNLNSYTTDRAVAERFAGVRTPEMPLISAAELAAAEAALSSRGEASFGGKTYRREPDGSIGIYDRSGNLVTDTDSLRTEAQRYNEYAAEKNAERAKALARVEELKLPIDDVVWATDRFGQKELIARPRSDKGPQMSLPDSLPMDQASRLERAREMGFDTEKPWYHATRKGNDIDEFKSNSNGLVYFSDNPSSATVGASAGAPHDIIPVYLRHSDPFNTPETAMHWMDAQSYRPVDRQKNVLDATGKDLVYVADEASAKGGQSVAVKPNQIRRIDAAFDPAKKDSANLLASDTTSPQAVNVFKDAGRASASPHAMLDAHYPEAGAGKGHAMSTGDEVSGRSWYHGTPHQFDDINGDAWFTSNPQTARAFGADRAGAMSPRHGGSAAGWQEAKNKANLLERKFAGDFDVVDPLSEATAIARQIGVDAPQTWDDAAKILQWADAQKQWIDEAKAKGKRGVLFKGVGDDPSGAISDHLVVFDPRDSVAAHLSPSPVLREDERRQLIDELLNAYKD